MRSPRLKTILILMAQLALLLWRILMRRNMICLLPRLHQLLFLRQHQHLLQQVRVLPLHPQQLQRRNP